MSLRKSRIFMGKVILTIIWLKTDGNGFVNVIMMCLIPKLSVPCFAQIDNDIYFQVVR